MTNHHHHEPAAAPPGAGHNRQAEPLQWQTPHLPEHRHEPDAQREHETDLDLVEKAFLEGFAATSDPTSFLRLAGVPFVAETDDGSRLTLLRVETAATTDIGLLTPRLGGDAWHYAPLPARLVSARHALTLVYYDGGRLAPLTLSQARELKVAGQAAPPTQ